MIKRDSLRSKFIFWVKVLVIIFKLNQYKVYLLFSLIILCIRVFVYVCIN